MITVNTLKNKITDEEVIHTEYGGTKDDLTYEFLALLENGLDDPKVRPAFQEAFEMFLNNHPLNSEDNNG